MSNGILPALVRLLAIVLIVLRDERIDAGQRELFFGGRRNRLDNQLCVAIGWLIHFVVVVAGVACGRG